jgi:Spy/CpxP family protein refolding chaperone
MRNLVWTAVALASLAGSTVAINSIAAADEPAGAHGWAADRAFMLDARLAGMKAALNLTQDQEKNWAPFEAAVRGAAKARMEAMRARREEMDNDEGPSPIARLNEFSNHLAMASAELKNIADAAKPLYDSLDETQKRHFGPLLRSLRGEERGRRRDGD